LREVIKDIVSQVAPFKDSKLAGIVRRLAEALQPTRIYLCDSYARGEATEEGDYDLLVLMRCPQEELRAAQRTA